MEWGLDLQTEHERWLTEEHVGRPVVVMNYPSTSRRSTCASTTTARTVAAMDDPRAGHRRDHRRQPARERLDVLDKRMAQFARRRALRLVPRFPPLRHGAARRLRPRLSAWSCTCAACPTSATPSPTRARRECGSSDGTRFEFGIRDSSKLPVQLLRIPNPIPNPAFA